MSGREDTGTSRTHYKAPYTPHHQIPTVQRYREEQEERKQKYGTADTDWDEPSRTERVASAAKNYWYGEQPEASEDGSTQPYQAANKNVRQDVRTSEGNMKGPNNKPQSRGSDTSAGSGQGKQSEKDENDGNVAEDTSETRVDATDPKTKRKQMKKMGEDPTERDVTDPVTHLPVKIHDFTSKDLKATPQNDPPGGTQSRSATGRCGAKSKSTEELNSESEEQQSYHSGLEAMFPPPEFESARKELGHIYQTATTVGMGSVVAMMALLLPFSRLFLRSNLSFYISTPLLILSTLGFGGFMTWGIRDWVKKKVEDVWDSEVWEAERKEGKRKAQTQIPESTQWLNSLLSSIWPLVNPDLFTSLADTLEDVMQASLPKMVRMVSVDDLGQGSESIRILGVRWLPTGASAKSVSQSGKLKNAGDPKKSDRNVPGEGQVQDDQEKKDPNGNDKDSSQNDENVAEGMEAEEGDFVNMEIAFAYRARAVKTHIRDRAKNAHLYLAFYLPGNIKFPVWVELHGFIGTMRLRLQLTPDPPFFSLCTMTFLGQPKVDVSCVPLTQKGLNIMDLPLLSNFVQSSVDAAVAEYVAPKSLTLDLKDMLMGDDFKKDTAARGVIFVRIKSAFDFKEGDSGFLMKDGSSDAYVSVGWAKFAKPMWSTRIIQSDMHPVWDEVAFVIVTAEELNVDERLRIQLWDSDRTTADDDLGRVELDLKQLMQDPKTNNRIEDREDGFKALQAGKSMPGKLQWSVGYFSKVKIQEDQLAQQTEEPGIRTIDQLHKKVDEESERKLREAKRDESDEIEQQKAQDFKEREDLLMISSPPPHEYPTGVLSITVHQITGLELEAVNKNQASKKEEASDEEEEGEDLPSSYCTIIINHQKVFKTRTKPKNSQPFFNAGCERVLKDWRNTDIHISVRDSRVHEDDPLLGIVYLPIGKLLSQRSQINGFFPIAGGVGYGRARISLVFRSIQMQVPRTLLGWDYGTIEMENKIESSDLPEDLQGMRLKVRTTLARAKFHSHHGEHGIWRTRHDRTVKFPVRKRYASPLIIEFRKNSALLDGTVAYGVFWLSKIADNEESNISVDVWKGGDRGRASTCCLERPEDEGAEKVGTLQLKLTFWSGLSGYHEKLAAKDANLGQVMEVLAVAHDNDEMEFDVGPGGASTDDEDGDNEKNDDDTDSDESDGQMTPTTTSTMTDRSNSTSSDLSKNGERGMVDSIRDYKSSWKQLHRRNRGLMQWKGPRTLKWMKHKVQHGEQKVESLFQHNERDPGLETEA
ncbi:hypothetical protein K490DRAFT_61988 [Saccharata proteae CBS 121410]|uniref:Meiotically up-regulated gene 190 protein n=1 Tax=Saccharata proteae CBS 121410 TaxID=1314787 RepID=A0A9P4HWT3_9PEZI|nr:hypothetical protein K490DRAFT_61988 [Saccharata proteae CBS 121410]